MSYDHKIIDLKYHIKGLINKKILNSKELEWINNYHKKVEKNLSKYIDFKDKSDFKKACLPI